MLKKLLVLVVFSLVIFGCGKTISDSSKLKARDGVVFFDNEQKPFTGKMVKYLPDGKNEVRIICKNGIVVFGHIDGEEIKYYENGQIKSIYTYKEGYLEGRFTEYYESGQIKKEGEFFGSNPDFTNTIPVHEEISYSETGEVINN